MNETTAQANWSRGGLTVLPTCPMCGCSRRDCLGSTSDHMIELPDVWTLWRCQDCRSVWLDPRPDDQSLAAVYDFEYITHKESAATKRSGWLNTLIDGYLARRFGISLQNASPWGAVIFSILPTLRMKLDYHGRHLQPAQGKRLLDVGCGNGDFVALASTMGWNAEGLDPDPSAVAVCHRRGLAVTQGFVEDMTPVKRVAYWDAITMSHCLEHVAEPARLIQSVYEMLAPGGELWIGLPNVASPGARYFGMDWESIDAPRHLVLPTQSALLRMCRAAGFDTVRLKRRGAHTGRLYRRSAEIAVRRGNGKLRHRHLLVRAFSAFVDLSATVSTRFADETVLVARKHHVAETSL